MFNFTLSNRNASVFVLTNNNNISVSDDKAFTCLEYILNGLALFWIFEMNFLQIFAVLEDIIILMSYDMDFQQNR